MDVEEDECPHGLGMKTACVICNGRAAREAIEAAADREVRYSFEAKYISLLNCGHFSTLGEQVHRLNDESIVCGECL